MTESEIRLQLITAAEKKNEEAFEKYAKMLDDTADNRDLIEFYKNILNG